MGMRGEYKELSLGQSVHIESFDDFPGPAAQVTSALEEKDGTTTMTVTVLSTSKEIRDSALASGMDHGAAASYDRLAALLEVKRLRRQSGLPTQRIARANIPASI